MKRVDILYNGQLFSVGGSDPDAIVERIEAAVRAGSGWLQVNDGEGERREALLLVTPGTPIAVIPIPGDGV